MRSEQRLSKGAGFRRQGCDCQGFRLQGAATAKASGLRVQGVGFRVQGSATVKAPAFTASTVKASGFREQQLSRAQVSGFRVQGSGGSGFRA